MLLPAPRLLYSAIVCVALSIAAIWLEIAYIVWLAILALFVVAAITDAVILFKNKNVISAHREIADTLPIGIRHQVTLVVSAGKCGAPIKGVVYDHHPNSFKTDDLPLSITINPKSPRCKKSYFVEPITRGSHNFGNIFLRLYSRLEFWQWQIQIAAQKTVRVFPNFARVKQYALYATDSKLSQLGILQKRRRGEGSDFEQLREYRVDDSIKHIDWKATARLRKTVVKEFQDERDQQILFLLDCSQRMRTMDDVLSHFDHALNAMLLVAYIGLRQGDSVGFATFGHEPPRYFRPRKSGKVIDDLLNATYDLQPTSRTADFLAASEMIMRHLTKRALIVLVTNLRDTDDSTLQPAIRQLQKRHKVLVANIRETGLDQLIQEPISDFEQAIGYAEAIGYDQARQMQLARLRAQHIDVCEARAAQLPIALANSYLSLKRSGNL